MISLVCLLINLFLVFSSFSCVLIIISSIVLLLRLLPLPSGNLNPPFRIKFWTYYTIVRQLNLHASQYFFNFFIDIEMKYKEIDNINFKMSYAKMSLCNHLCSSNSISPHDFLQ
ncbi:hypothetical protein HMPREF1705_04740 [Acetomicrobium hydrogeniformans ATCC BAA-1850]|uniref:Uncharacterized protein n=1 Tax=Acetomicrobium hydrogeniformans ATCC BAA-1850 TaxID=592015 RepID=A0A0T5X8S6_9BACT|nr:hypothetical protein HMPREF1705_04740 [Acetomicrobium hydrogeniformans ATCC BAA-1850]